MTSLFSANIIMFFILFVLFIICLYILTILWTIKDAKARGANHKTWGIVAIIPFIGALIYAVMRPPLLKIDQEEQSLDIALKQRQLMQYGECARCGYPVKDDYVVCPNCKQKLKDVCSVCKKPLDFNWVTCPYCGTPKMQAVPVSSGYTKPAASASSNNVAATTKVSAKPAAQTAKVNPSAVKSNNVNAGKTVSHVAQNNKGAKGTVPTHTAKTNNH